MKSKPFFIRLAQFTIDLNDISSYELYEYDDEELTLRIGLKNSHMIEILDKKGKYEKSLNKLLKPLLI